MRRSLASSTALKPKKCRTVVASMKGTWVRVAPCQYFVGAICAARFRQSGTPGRSRPDLSCSGTSDWTPHRLSLPLTSIADEYFSFASCEHAREDCGGKGLTS